MSGHIFVWKNSIGDIDFCFIPMKYVIGVNTLFIYKKILAFDKVYLNTEIKEIIFKLLEDKNCKILPSNNLSQEEINQLPI